VLRLQTSLNGIIGTARFLQRRSKAAAFQAIIWHSACNDPLLPVSSKHSFHVRQQKELPAAMACSPYRKEQYLKPKQSIAPTRKLSERKRNDMLVENRDLNQKVQKKKQRVRSFLHEMDQMLAEHE